MSAEVFLLHFFLGVLAYCYGISDVGVWFLLHTLIEVAFPATPAAVVTQTAAALGGWLAAAATRTPPGIGLRNGAVVVGGALLALFVACRGRLFRPRAVIRLLDPRALPKFVNSLREPPRLTPPPDVTTIVRLKQGRVWMGLRDSRGRKQLTTVWGYEHDGQVHTPGPTIVTRRGSSVRIRWENELPKGAHLFPVDTTLHVASGYSPKLGRLPAVVHLHGGHTSWESDGHPEAWVTQGFQTHGPYFRRKTYTYDNSEDATLLWYHDHTMGMTRLNNYAGLVGMYTVTDETEQSLIAAHRLPPAARTLLLAVADKLFTSEGELYFPGVHGQPTSGVSIEPGWPNPTQLHEFWGTVIIVNGTAWPKKRVMPAQYRLRLLNAADTRTFVFTFSNGMKFKKIGSGGGFLEKAASVTHLVLAPAQRADVLVDFRGLAGQAVVLQNAGPDVLFKGYVDRDDPAAAPATVVPTPGLALSDGQGGIVDPTDPSTTGLVLRFDVTSSGAQAPLAELTLPPLPLGPPPGVPVRVRKLALFKGEDTYGRNVLLLGTLEKGSLVFHDPATEVVPLNSWEIWEIFNTTVSGHPIHLHLVEFEVLNRQPFSGTVTPKTHRLKSGKTTITGGRLSNVQLKKSPRPPGPAERGPEDTVVCLPKEVTRIRAFFDKVGHFVWHCHLLSHEDYDMMRPLDIVFPPRFPTLIKAKERPVL